MIRDPSDGTVREKLSKNNEFNPQTEYSGSYGSKPVLETKTSGLPISRAKAEYLERLEKSREWLKQYFEPKETPE